MKIRFEPDQNEWELPELELQAALTKAISEFEIKKTTHLRNRKFILMLTFVATSVIGATCVVIWGQFLPLLAGAIMYWEALAMAKKYTEENS